MSLFSALWLGFFLTQNFCEQNQDVICNTNFSSFTPSEHNSLNRDRLDFCMNVIISWLLFMTHDKA